ncbi:TPA: bifunctional biotin--[acetyl-CoA-carboxylase] ligase/biotin operon repressor BirA [Streptococcus agalactiae]|nr:bifunctional biotin--[acetyl-CoA-carboxylase] ligase/biotin operon repressor BirA [Streptococcus agalactiae]
MKTYEKIYQILSKNNNFISGETIANQLNISRTAIWKGIKTLEELGLEIESVTNKGYRLVSGDILLPEQLEQEIGIKVSLNNNSASTQLDAKMGIESKLKTPHLFLAPNQKKAKGRFDRPFFTSNQGGIYMSLLLQPNVPIEDIKPYTVMVASSAVKAISRLTGITPEIKWVNDIYLDNKKIAGILTEAIASVESGLVTNVIIGLGINFYIKEFPRALTKRAGSLFTEQPTITRNQLITEIWNLFFNIPLEDHLKVYREKSLVLDKTVSFMDGQTMYSGKAIDITDKGYLVVELDDGQLKTLRSGEISLSSW